MSLTSKLILSFVVLGLCSAGSGFGRTAAPEDELPDAEEYAAYAALVTALVEKRKPAARVVVINHRTTGFGSPHYLSGMSLKETHESFKSKNVNSYKFERPFDLKIEYLLASEEDGLGMFWNRFAARYPQGFGTLLLSRAGINGQKTEALVYVEERQGPDARASGYTLRKTGGAWEVSRERVLLVTQNLRCARAARAAEIAN
jgi:hypothetical protein